MKKRFFLLLLPVILAVTLILPTSADFGSFSGDSDYGGSYDFDSGSSFDSYDSYDYGGGSTYYYFGDSDYDTEISPVMIVIVLLIVVAYLILRAKMSHASPASGKPPVNAGAQRTEEATLRPMEAYAALDPAFDAADFREKLSNLYVQMQNQWTARDLDPLRPYFTDALFTQMERQIDQMKKQNRTNYVDRIAVLSVTLRGFRQADGEDHIIAELQTRIVDYTMNDNDGSIVSGSDKLEKFMTYEWELTRTSGTLTSESPAADTPKTVICPNCGAPVDINASARCEYCDTVLTQETHTWAIRSIKGISQVSG